jgi:hypothetical protein
MATGRLGTAFRLGAAALLAAAAILLGLLRRAARAEARTAEEFIEKYVEAHRRGDVDAVLAMRVDPDPLASGAAAGGSSARLAGIDGELAAERRRALEESRDRRDLWWRTWERTRYVAETDHGDHIHVDIIAGAARSEVVLVRDRGLLKIYLHPSRFDHAREP